MMMVVRLVTDIVAIRRMMVGKHRSQEQASEKTVVTVGWTGIKAAEPRTISSVAIGPPYPCYNPEERHHDDQDRDKDKNSRHREES